jgi:hypothetical protein
MPPMLNQTPITYLRAVRDTRTHGIGASRAPAGSAASAEVAPEIDAIE